MRRQRTRVILRVLNMIEGGPHEATPGRKSKLEDYHDERKRRVPLGVGDRATPSSRVVYILPVKLLRFTGFLPTVFVLVILDLVTDGGEIWVYRDWSEASVRR